MTTLLRASVLSLALCTVAFAADNAPPPASRAKVPAGAYTLDKAHASLIFIFIFIFIFKVSHLGFSNYTARFRSFDAELQFDPQNLAASKLVATVDVRSLETDFPKTPELDFNETLLGKE